MHATLVVEGSHSMSLRQVPFEALKRAAKDKKGSMDEFTSIVKMLEGQNTANMNAAEQLTVLNKMTLRLQHLKSRVSTSDKSLPCRVSFAQQRRLALFVMQLDENNQEEEADAIRCQARIQHLQKLGAPAKDEVINWNRKRLDRLLVDHLLHSGYYNAAELLTSESNIKVHLKSGRNSLLEAHLLALCHADRHQESCCVVKALMVKLLMQDLVDLHVFAGAQKVVSDLKHHDCTAALAWCEEHRSRLKKAKNKLEFRLRMQARPT